MEKRLTYQMKETDFTEKIPVWNVERVLKEMLGFSRREISHAKFMEHGICVDGKKARINQRLLPGCIVEASGSENAMGESRRWMLSDAGKLKICYEDEDLLVISKPAGLVSHSGKGHYKDSLLNRLVNYYEKQGENNGFHRSPAFGGQFIWGRYGAWQECPPCRGAYFFAAFFRGKN